MDVAIPPPIPLPPQPVAPSNINDLITPREQHVRRDSGEIPEEENLLLRRSEIINRLKEIDDNKFNDDIDDLER